jgi:hypothetical protein
MLPTMLNGQLVRGALSSERVAYHFEAKNYAGTVDNSAGARYNPRPV